MTSQKTNAAAWPLHEAKARFSEFVATCLKDGPQMVTKHGVEAAVLVPVSEWRRLHEGRRSSLKELLLSNEARIDHLAPSRGEARRRPVVPMR